MADIGKVIKALERCTTHPCYCNGCEYQNDCYLDSEPLMKDALELLKDHIRPSIHGHWVNDEQCSECDCDAPSFISGSSWVMYKTRYCPNCGASMDNADMELYDE